MAHVDDVVLDGVSGSVPGARTDIDQIVRRKVARDDFDVLLVQDMSRFTRGGAEHGMKLEYDLNAAGIDVIFVADRLPEGDHSGIIKSVGFYAARQYAKSLSFATTRGAMSSLERGRLAHSRRPPFGVDRLYISTDGKPLHVIRNLADGSQVKLDPATRAVLETFAAGDGHGRSAHYRIQANQRVVLIPGAPDRVSAVQQMFRRRLIDNWAGFRIAKELNEQGVSSGIGMPWSVSTINHILRNPVYTGIGIANRFTSGIYHFRAANAPRPSTLDRKMLAARRKPAPRTRPEPDWIEIEYPALKDYLGDLRAAAVAWQRRQLDKLIAGPRRSRVASKDRHVDSSYILKSIARSKQGDHPLTGRTCGPKGKKVRYYAVHRGFTVPKSEKTLRRLIHADPLERAVLGALENFFLTSPDLRPKLLKLIEQQRRAAKADVGDVKGLESERSKITAQIDLAIDSLGALGRAAAQSKLRQLEGRLADLTDRIDRAKAVAPVPAEDAGAVADQIVQRLAKIGQSLHEMPLPALRALLATMVVKLEVDLETRAVVLELALPSTDAMCLEDRFVHKTGHEAQQDGRLTMAVFICDWIDRPRETRCLSCRRAA